MFEKLLEPFRNQRGSTAGQAIVAVAGGVVGFVVSGGNPAGAFLGFSIGMSLGGVLFPPSIDSPKPSPSGLSVQTSQLGQVVPVLYGSRKIAGNLIWYGDFQTHTHEEESGGKGGGGQTSTTYTYSVGMAWGICMAPSDQRKTVVKLWAGKDLVDPSRYRVYDGSQAAPDSYVASFTERDPVWKNLCYVVMESYDLGSSPQIPFFTFEVISISAETASPSTTWCSVAMSSSGKYQSAAYNNGLYVSSDYGATWVSKPVSAKYVHVSSTGQYQVVRDDINTKTWRSSDYGATWSEITVANGYQIRFSADGHYQLSGTGDGNPVRVSSDYGATWTLKTGTQSGFGIAMSSDGKYMLTADFFLSSDYGASWARPQSISGYDAAMSSSGQYMLFAGNPNIKVSLDSGASWTDKVAAPINTYWTAAAVSSNGKYQSVCMRGTKKKVYYSSDYGIAWTEGAFDFPSDPREIQMSADGKYQTVRANPYLYVSSDYGVNWVQRGPDIGSDVGERVAMSSSGQYQTTFKYIGVGPLYFSSDYGQTWSAQKVITDAPPSDISKDILTNNLFGLGLSVENLDESVFAATKDYCNTNDLLLSMVFDHQMSVLDALGSIIQHHDGYITYYDGLIAHNQLQIVSPTESLSKTNNDFIQEDDHPVVVTKAGGRDYHNKIIIEYTKREAEYVTGTAIADDIVDIDNYRLKESVLRLDGFCTYARAAKMAWRFLKKELIQPQKLTFKVGPKSKAKIFPGNVVSITDDSVELASVPIRILATREATDRRIEVEAVEENNNVYSTGYMTAGQNPPTPPESPALHDPALSVIRPMALEIPPLFSSACQALIVYSKPPNNQSWMGASIYKAYESGGSYKRQLSNPGSGVTGKVIAVWPGIDYYSGRYIRVNITSNWGDSLVCMTTLHACDAAGVKWNNESMIHSNGNTLNGDDNYCSDTNISNYWQFYASNLPNWWKVDLGQTRKIAKFKTQVLGGYTNRNIKDFTVQVSDNDVDWTTILTAQTLQNDSEQTFDCQTIPVHLEPDKTCIDVELDWDYTLASATSFDALLSTPGKNLMVVIGNSPQDGIFCRYQTVELLGSKQWRLSGLICNVTNFPLIDTLGSIAADQDVVFYQGTQNVLSFLEAEKHRTLYFKPPSFNLYGEEQSLADVNSISLAIQAICDKPLPIYNIKVNGMGVDFGDSIIVANGDIQFAWMTRNRFNSGGANYSKSDALIDDSDFQNFELEIWRNSVKKRTVTQTAKSWTYTTAMQAEDGGTGNITFKCRVIAIAGISDDKSCTVTAI